MLSAQIYEFTLQIENVLSQTTTTTVHISVTDDIRPLIELETQCPQKPWLKTHTLSIQPLVSFDQYHLRHCLGVPEDTKYTLSFQWKLQDLDVNSLIPTSHESTDEVFIFDAKSHADPSSIIDGHLYELTFDVLVDDDHETTAATHITRTECQFQFISPPLMAIIAGGDRN